MIKVVKTEYVMVGPEKVDIYVVYEVDGRPIQFAADLHGGPYNYAFLQGVVDDYAGCLARYGYNAGMADDLAVYRGALDYLREHGQAPRI